MLLVKSHAHSSPAVLYLAIQSTPEARERRRDVRCARRLLVDVDALPGLRRLPDVDVVQVDVLDQALGQPHKPARRFG